MPQILMRGAPEVLHAPPYAGCLGGRQRPRRAGAPSLTSSALLAVAHGRPSPCRRASCPRRRGQVVGRADGLPSISVTMSPPSWTGCRRAGRDVAALEPGLRGGAALLDGLDQRAALDRQAEAARASRRSSAGRRRGRRARRGRSSSCGSTCLAVSIGTAKPMPTLPPAAAAGLDLRVDPDHAAGGVEQRAARVAGVDRRVGLHDVVDREAVGRLDRALQRRDDAGRQRAVEPERVADGDRRVADLQRLGRAERQRRAGRGRRGRRAAARGR